MTWEAQILPGFATGRLCLRARCERLGVPAPEERGEIYVCFKDSSLMNI